MKKLPARVTTTFGIHVRGTPLWIDSTRRRELCVVTSIGAKLPPAHTRLVATPELAKILSLAGHKSRVLATPRDRWVGIGGEHVQLVDAGAGMLSAAAVVKLREETVLVTGPLRAATPDWPRADHIIAHVPALQHKGDTLDAIVSIIVAATRDVRCSVRVESLEIAAALGQALIKRAISLKGRGLVAALGYASAKASVDLALTRVAHGPGKTFDIDSGLGLTRGAHVTLPLRWFADRAGVEALVASARPKRLTLVGPRSKSLSVATEVIWQAEPRQLSLSDVQRVEN